MKRTSALIFAFLGIALAIAHIPVAARAGSKNPKPAEPKLEDAVTFKVRVQPSDPFDPRNKLGAKSNGKVRRGEVVRVELNGILKDGWNTYPITQRTSEQG